MSDARTFFLLRSAHPNMCMVWLSFTGNGFFDYKGMGIIIPRR
ncbi:Uracil DNA glycosylase [Pseudomonas syringae pv. actinidiae]|uniref:Uracil DNA glycosylase n=1 Tax=Pseudomonas syringae pv. actinidiae TaxID=103796 RepID=A0A2V0QLL7_PSESF|nr:Uracil DNA glycosylase [Pseudomonas syringae pv. actinidiae]